jgi:hypothetical protein
LLVISLLFAALQSACQEIADRRNELADIQDCRPNLEFADCKSANLYIPVLAFSTDSGVDCGTQHGPFQLLQIRYINNATHPEKSASAEKVSARLVFTRRGTDVVVQEKYGAWAVGGVEAQFGWR